MSFLVPTNNEAEVTENETEEGTTNKPVYVCRASVNSVVVSGQLRPDTKVCVVSLYGKVSEHKQYDILKSIENSARLSWVHKSKYTLLLQGAVTSGEKVLRTFVARRPADSHNKEGKEKQSQYERQFLTKIFIENYYKPCKINPNL